MIIREFYKLMSAIGADSVELRLEDQVHFVILNVRYNLDTFERRKRRERK